MAGRNHGTDNFECCEPGLPDLARTAPQGHDVDRQAGLTLLVGYLPFEQDHFFFLSFWFVRSRFERVWMGSPSWILNKRSPQGSLRFTKS
jgi:hypothetical protein